MRLLARLVVVVVGVVFWPVNRATEYIRSPRNVQQGFDAGVTTAPNAGGVETVIVFYTIGSKRHSFGFAPSEASEHATNILGAVSHASKANKARAGGPKRAVPKSSR